MRPGDRTIAGWAVHLALTLAASVALLPSVAQAQSYTPASLRQAYGFNLLSSNYVAGTTGAGQTIAIIDAYGALGSGNQSNLYTDVNAFDKTYGLPSLAAGSSLTVMSQNGGTLASSLPSYDASWAKETTLDVEYAHAIAPGANIEVVEASSNQPSDLYTAAGYAASLGTPIVSMSFNISESVTGAVSGAESTFNPSSSLSYSASTPGANQSPVVFVASTGDTGQGVSAPSSNRYVVAVGGTSLSVNSNGNYSSEIAWSGSGGGTSSSVPEPDYQRGVQNTGSRTVPDVAFLADPGTLTSPSGVDIVFDGILQATGGTSVGAPSWAGLFALANQQRQTNGLPDLTSLMALQEMYSIFGTSAYSNAFHDIVGNDSASYAGYFANNATAGYDQATGLGSPVTSDLVPYLASVPEPASAVALLMVAPLLLNRRRAVLR